MWMFLQIGASDRAEIEKTMSQRKTSPSTYSFTFRPHFTYKLRVQNGNLEKTLANSRICALKTANHKASCKQPIKKFKEMPLSQSFSRETAADKEPEKLWARDWIKFPFVWLDQWLDNDWIKIGSMIGSWDWIEFWLLSLQSSHVHCSMFFRATFWFQPTTPYLSALFLFWVKR